MAALEPSDRAPGLLLGPGVDVPDDATVGANVVIHEATELGPGVTIDDGAILGRRPRLAAGSAAAGSPLAPLVLEAGVTVCAQAIVFAGAHVLEGAILGDQSHVRERARIGAHSVIGRGSQVDNDVVIGERVSVQSMAYLTAFSVIEDDVFVGPGARTTNDNTMSRRDVSAPLEGATLRRACRIGGGAVICPGVEIGEEAFVAAGAVVVVAVAPRAIVMGVPAEVRGEVTEADLVERWR
jgi:acetyltransferase-like isoleucine patch superfamily enzyme